MAEKAKAKKKNTPMKEVWRRLKRNHMAMVGLVIMVIVILVAIFAPVISPYDYAEQDYEHTLEFPSREHILGTDNFGRDIFSRIIYGSRYTLLIGMGSVAAAALIGTVLGAIAAYFKRLDNVIMRIIDIFMGIPTIIMSISIVVALGASVKNLMIAMIVTTAPSFARVVRAQMLTVKELEFVEAARSIGAGTFRILARHILPNSLAPIIIQCTLGVVNIILVAAGLSFIGVGVPHPNPEWGLMISAGRTYLRDYWYISIFPGLAIIITTYALNLLGDGLRDALDPRLKQ